MQLIIHATTENRKVFPTCKNYAQKRNNDRRRVSLWVASFAITHADPPRLKIRRIRAESVPWKIVKWFFAGSESNIIASFRARCFSGRRTESQLTDRWTRCFLFLIDQFQLPYIASLRKPIIIHLNEGFAIGSCEQLREARTHFIPLVHFPRPCTTSCLPIDTLTWLTHTWNHNSRSRKARKCVCSRNDDFLVGTTIQFNIPRKVSTVITTFA